jgi:hypothetical protein
MTSRDQLLLYLGYSPRFGDGNQFPDLLKNVFGECRQLEFHVKHLGGECYEITIKHVGVKGSQGQIYDYTDHITGVVGDTLRLKGGQMLTISAKQKSGLAIKLKEK